MILVDVNLLLYATFRTSSRHQAALSWLEAKLNGPTRLGLPWHSVLAYLRISTNPRAYTDAITMADAWEQIESWLACAPVWIPEPTERHAEILGRLLGGPHAIHSNLVSDAHLAALAIGHGLTLCSTDGDFARFQELRWENPLA